MLDFRFLVTFNHWIFLLGMGNKNWLSWVFAILTSYVPESRECNYIFLHLFKCTLKWRKRALKTVFVWLRCYTKERISRLHLPHFGPALSWNCHFNYRSPLYECLTLILSKKTTKFIFRRLFFNFVIPVISNKYNRHFNVATYDVRTTGLFFFCKILLHGIRKQILGRN